MKALSVTLSIFCSFLNCAYAQPIISSFSPSSGKVGTSITISGSGFSTTPSNNIVFVGDIRVSPISATSNSIVVNFPVGGTYSNIKVNVSDLQAYSDKEFNVAFGNSEAVSSSTFGSGSNISVDNGPNGLEIADIDGDGKPDVGVSIGATTGEISIFRNTSTIGSISLASKVDIATASLCSDFVFADIDGDGKFDAVAANSASTNNIQIFRNLSTSGSVSFTSPNNFTRTSHFAGSVMVGDLDGDGKPDVVNTNRYTSSISISQNTSTSGSISMATYFDLTTGATPITGMIEDVDGDGKRDIVIPCYSGNSIYFFRNIHSSGSLSSSSFSSSSISTTSGNPLNVQMADIDGDGKRDLICTRQSGGNILVYRNTSTSGTISFASPVTLTSGTTTQISSVADINGDGKPEVIAANIGSNNFKIFQNNSTSGTISFVSASGVAFTTGSQPYHAHPVDLDGDTKPDMITANYGANNIQVFRNTQLASEPSTASSFMSFSSLTASSMTVSWANGNGARRIVALKASGTPPSVTSPVDATEYTANASFGSGADLGSGWYVVYDGTGSSVSVTDLTLNQQYYSVIFEYNGKDATINYQTSYASGTQLLPVEFLSFTATGSEKGVQLNWSTAWEINNSHFEIERSTQGLSDFTYVDELIGKGNSAAISAYSYLDNEIAQQMGPTFYRLKQVDFNGAFTYSAIVSANTNKNDLEEEAPYLKSTLIDEVLNIVYDVNKSDLVSIQVVNVNGQQVFKSEATDKLFCQYWQPGVYCIVIDYRNSRGESLQSKQKVLKR